MSSALAVPKVYWSYTRVPALLTLEYLAGVSSPPRLENGRSTTSPARLSDCRDVDDYDLPPGLFHQTRSGEHHVLSPERIGTRRFRALGKLTVRLHVEADALFIDAAAENIDSFPTLSDLGCVIPKERE